MKLSDGFFITRKEFPNDENSCSGKLLVKSGMIYKNSNGSYMYLPLGYKVLENIKKIIREEHNKIKANEVLMPSLVTQNVFDKSNRIKTFDKELFKIIDRDGNHLCLCPTHEELFAILSSIRIKSYKDLHFTLYQISNKYRDESYVSGMLRKKEFIMCDSYSFDSNESGLSISYDTMYHVYSKIFKRLNINFLVAESDPETMLGNYSEEFHAKCDTGDTEIVKCTKCSYTASRAIAEVFTKKIMKESIQDKIKKVYTPNVRSIDEVANYLKVDVNKIIKSLIYKIDNDYVMVIMKGNDEVNENKLKNLLKANNISLATEEEIETIGGNIGFIGPVKATMKVIADNSIRYISTCICGSNITNYHFVNVKPKVDFKVDRFADIKLFDENDKCPICYEKAEIIKTIEVANIFKLGTTYGDIFNLKYSDEKNEYNRVYMGSYGIGLDRCMSAIVEMNHDENGIIWPIDVAPYKVAIVVVNVLDRDSLRYSNELYNKLNSLGIDTILDDRKESPGVKFKDIDLIGIPIRVTVGFKSSDNIIELKLRNEKETIELNKIDIINTINKIINKEN